MGIRAFAMSYCACQEVVTRGKSSQAYEHAAEKKTIEWVRNAGTVSRLLGSRVPSKRWIYALGWPIRWHVCFKMIAYNTTPYDDKTISYPTFYWSFLCIYWPYRNAIVKLPICTIHDYIHSNQQKEGAWLGRADLLGESSSVVVTTTTTTNRHTRWWGRASGEKVPKTIAGAIWGGCRIE